jgi:hypothetical protein
VLKLKKTLPSFLELVRRVKQVGLKTSKLSFTPIIIFIDGESTSNATVLVNQLLKGRYSARYYLPDKIDKATIEDIVDAAKNSPSGYNTQYAPGLFVFSPASQLTPISGPWKVYCIAGSVKEAISAEMLEADKNHAPYAPQYTYYPPTLPPDYAARRFDFGKVFYGALGIERDDLAGRDTENARN